MSIDPSQEANRRSSFWVAQAWGLDGRTHVLVDQIREQTGYDGLQGRIIRFLKKLLPSVVLIENAGVGKALARDIERKVGIDVISINPAGLSKMERMKLCADLILAGRVQIAADAAFRSEFVEELIAFPHGDFDDQVDAASQFLNWASNQLVIPSRRRRAVAVCSSPSGTMPRVSQIHVSGSDGRALACVGRPTQR